jgi:TldD protein
MKIARRLLLLISAMLLGISAAFAAALPASPAAASQPALLPSGDPVLHALQAEMARSKAKLRLESNPAPYFLAYRVVDVDSWAANAALGGVRSESRTRIRFLTVQLRLGDYKEDSSSPHGDGAMEVVPLDNNESAIRFQVWSATDKAYKSAIASLTAKRARLQQLNIDHPVDDFARASAVESIHPTVRLPLDASSAREPWLRMLRQASALYIRDPRVQYLETSLNFRAVNRYYVNSDGTAVRDGELLYQMLISCDTQADDGMHLERDTDFTSNSLSGLPSNADFQQKTGELLATLKELREAPLAAEDYHGPVLLASDAASTVFSSLIGANVLGFRPGLGQDARVRGAFASSYKTRVLPAFLSLDDDPTLTSMAGTPLLGHYEVDDEGVRAQRVPVIQNGILQNYLLGREPIRDFPASNGHARTLLPVGWPAPALGNLVVHASEAVSPEALKQQLITLCKERGLDYGYYVETMAGPFNPRLLYRVWVKDGRQELVRGALFGDLDLRTMRNDIVAAGNDPSVDNELHPQPHSIVTPSILFDDLEVKRQTGNKQKLPDYPSPEMAAAESARHAELATKAQAKHDEPAP